MNKRIFAVILVLLTLALCACTPAAQTGSGDTTTGGNVQAGVADSIFDNEDQDDKSFSASVSVDQKDPTGTTQIPTETDGIDGTMGVEDNKIVTTERGGSTEETTQGGSTSATDPAPMTYEAFMALSGKEQQAYQESFTSIQAFFDWYNAAKETYEKENPPIYVGGNGTVTMPNP